MVRIAKDILETYTKINSIEIWTENTVDSTLKQIEFYWESGLIKKEDALNVCNELSEMLTAIEKQAEMGSKFISEKKSAENENNFAMYCSDVTIGNNSILVKMGNITVSYLTYNTFNSMVTTNTAFCNETEQWLKTLSKNQFSSVVFPKNSDISFFKKLMKTSVKSGE